MPISPIIMKNIANLNIRSTAGGAVICVKVIPGSSRDKVVGVLGGALKIATTTAPEKGRANKAVAQTLAKALGVDSRYVTLSAGPTNPRKEFQIANETTESLREKLAQI